MAYAHADVQLHAREIRSKINADHKVKKKKKPPTPRTLYTKKFILRGPIAFTIAVRLIPISESPSRAEFSSRNMRNSVNPDLGLTELPNEIGPRAYITKFTIHYFKDQRDMSRSVNTTVSDRLDRNNFELFAIESSLAVRRASRCSFLLNVRDVTLFHLV